MTLRMKYDGEWVILSFSLLATFIQSKIQKHLFANDLHPSKSDKEGIIISRLYHTVNDSSHAWYQQGTNDISTARRMLYEDIYYACALFAHQAVEKIMKSVLLDSGFIPQKTHDLLSLGRTIEVELRVSIDPIIDYLRDINPNYTISKCPDAAIGIPADMFTKKRAEELIHSPEKVTSWCDQYLHLKRNW